MGCSQGEYALLVVAQQTGNALAVEQLHHLQRLRAQVDLIAQGEDQVGRLRANVLQDGLEREQVGVNIADTCDAHDDDLPM